MKLPRLFILCSVVAILALSSSARAGEPIPLRAGPVTMVFDADNVFLRYIRVGKHEVLRGINAPIRNENWATIAPEVSNVQVELCWFSGKWKSAAGTERKVATSCR